MSPRAARWRVRSRHCAGATRRSRRPAAVKTRRRRRREEGAAGLAHGLGVGLLVLGDGLNRVGERVVAAAAPKIRLDLLGRRAVVGGTECASYGYPVNPSGWMQPEVPEVSAVETGSVETISVPAVPGHQTIQLESGQVLLLILN